MNNYLQDLQTTIKAIEDYQIKEGDYTLYCNALQQLNDSYEYLRKLEQKKYKNLGPEERYSKDPWFKRIVDLMRQSIANENFTTKELREAVDLASLINNSNIF